MHLDIAGALLKVLLLWILTAPHEFAHAWTALRLGDDTPLREGRVTLNPLAHVDWIGTALLPFIMSLLGSGFLGWGKPVRTEPSKLRGGLNGLAIVSIAGPLSNVDHGRHYGRNRDSDAEVASRPSRNSWRKASN